MVAKSQAAATSAPKRRPRTPWIGNDTAMAAATSQPPYYRGIIPMRLCRNSRKHLHCQAAKC